MKTLPAVAVVLLGVYFVVQASAAVVKGGYAFGAADNVNFTYVTHTYYAFAGVDPTTYRLVPEEGDTTIGAFVATAKRSNPAVVPLLSIGGAAAPFTTFAEMVSTSARREAFINSSVALAREYEFEGLDLDWESPQSQAEMQNLATLLEEWHAATVTEAQASGKSRLLLTAAVSYQSILLYTGDMNQTWPIAAFNDYLDWANVMNYDYHGSWEPTQTGEHTALYDPASNINTDYGISNWLQAGLLPSKLCLGLAYYGKLWNLTSAQEVGVGAPASGGGNPIVYRDIVEYNAGGATVVYDNTTVSMYSYKVDELTWVGYDNPETITAKVLYAKSRNLLGYFAWALQHDTNTSSLAAAAYNAWT